MQNVVTFHNHTKGKWAGESGHVIQVTVSEQGSPQATAETIMPEDSWSYPRTDEIKYTIESLTIKVAKDCDQLDSGWATYKGSLSGHVSHDLYIVESNNALGFNVTHEWPTKHLEKY